MNKGLPSARIPFLVLAVIDLLLLNISYRIAYYLQINQSFFLDNDFLSLAVAFNVAWIVSAQINKIDRIEKYDDFKYLSINLFNTFFLHAFLVLAYIVSFKEFYYSRLFLTFNYSFNILSITAFRLLFVHVIRRYGNFGLKSKRVIIVGSDEPAKALYRYFNAYKYFGYKFMGFFDTKPGEEIDENLVKGTLSELKAYCLKNQIDEIYYTLSLADRFMIADLINFSDDNNIYFKMAPDFNLINQKEVNFTFFDNIPILSVRKDPLGYTFNKVVKRVFDIVFSMVFITLFFPLAFLLIGVAIRLESKGPIFFKQLRPGKKGKLFESFKFRTTVMRPAADGRMQQLVTTNVGKFLKKLGLDDLPLFFNVLLGDMSVVGPRLNKLRQQEMYAQIIEKYPVRNLVTPGLTGYAQVKGVDNNNNELEEILRKKVEYDVKYIENWSLFLDIKIIFLTFIQIISGRQKAI